MPSRRNRKFKNPDSEETELYDKVTKIETDIIDRVNKLKQGKKNYDCIHNVASEDAGPYDPTINYYELFWKTYMLNELKKERIISFGDHLSKVYKKIETINVNSVWFRVWLGRGRNW